MVCLAMYPDQVGRRTRLNLWDGASGGHALPDQSAFARAQKPPTRACMSNTVARFTVHYIPAYPARREEPEAYSSAPLPVLRESITTDSSEPDSFRCLPFLPCKSPVLRESITQEHPSAAPFVPSLSRPASGFRYAQPSSSIPPRWRPATVIQTQKRTRCETASFWLESDSNYWIKRRTAS